MDLNKTFDFLTEWCKTNNVMIMNGYTNDRGIKVLVYEDHTLEDFLEIAKKQEVKLFILTKHEFEFKSEIEEYLGEDFEIKEQSNLNDFREYDGLTHIYLLSWIKNGGIFQFIQQAEWYEQFDLLISDYKKEIDDKLNKKQLEIDRKTKKVAKAVATHPKYYNYHTRSYKIDQLIRKVVQEEGFEEDLLDSLFKIRRLAEEIFLKKFYKKANETFRKKVSDLKSEGKSKKEIVAKLDTTRGLVDKVI